MTNKTEELLNTIYEKELDAGLIDEEVPKDETAAPANPILSRFKVMDDVQFYSPLLNCGHHDDRVFSNDAAQRALGGVRGRIVIIQDVPGKKIGVVVAGAVSKLTHGFVKGHSLDGLVPEDYGLWATDHMLLKPDEYQERVDFLRVVKAKENDPRRRAAMAAAREYIAQIEETIIQK